MQPFNEYISHFIDSHITSKVVCSSRNDGLDLLPLSFHTMYRMHPFNADVFKPFKQHFCKYQDF